MQIPEVEETLEELVEVLKGYIPTLREVRVFGSYNNGNWNPETSDVDVFILFEGRDCSGVSGKEVGRRMQGKLRYKGKFELFFNPTKSLGLFWALEHNMMNGRLLYKYERVHLHPIAWLKKYWDKMNKEPSHH